MSGALTDSRARPGVVDDMSGALTDSRARPDAGVEAHRGKQSRARLIAQRLGLSIVGQ